MNLFVRIAVSFTTVIFLVGCGSLEKKANKEFEAGQYAAAAALYEKVLAKEPANAQVQERLKTSRLHVLEDRLIVVRQLRMSENFAEALDHLDETIMQENSWKISPTGDAKYCRVPVSLSSRTQIETVMKCLKGSDQAHDFVENWFKSKFGLPYKTVGQAIGFGV